MTLSDRCLIHGDKMDMEGWYATANVLWLAAEELERLQAKIAELESSIPRSVPQPLT